MRACFSVCVSVFGVFCVCVGVLVYLRRVRVTYHINVRRRQQGRVVVIARTIYI